MNCPIFSLAMLKVKVDLNAHKNELENVSPSSLYFDVRFLLKHTVNLITDSKYPNSMPSFLSITMNRTMNL